jgi:hypothetical protein
MGRRIFNRLIIEISLAVGRHVSRYGLWMHLHEVGIDPEQLTQQRAVAFCGEPLALFLKEQGLTLPPEELRELQRSMTRFNPLVASPYEQMERIAS